MHTRLLRVSSWSQNPIESKSGPQAFIIPRRENFVLQKCIRPCRLWQRRKTPGGCICWSAGSFFSAREHSALVLRREAISETCDEKDAKRAEEEGKEGKKEERKRKKKKKFCFLLTLTECVQTAPSALARPSPWRHFYPTIVDAREWERNKTFHFEFEEPRWGVWDGREDASNAEKHAVLLFSELRKKRWEKSFSFPREATGEKEGSRETRRIDRNRKLGNRWSETERFCRSCWFAFYSANEKEHLEFARWSPIWMENSRVCRCFDFCGEWNGLILWFRATISCNALLIGAGHRLQIWLVLIDDHWVFSIYILMLILKIFRSAGTVAPMYRALFDSKRWCCSIGHAHFVLYFFFGACIVSLSR